MEVTLAIKVELEELVPKDLVFILQNADAARIVRFNQAVDVSLGLHHETLFKNCVARTGLFR